MASADVTGAMYHGCDIVAFFDEGISYGVFYLEDMVNAFKYTACDYVSKVAYVEGERIVEGGEFQGYIVGRIMDDAIILKKGKISYEWRP